MSHFLAVVALAFLVEADLCFVIPITYGALVMIRNLTVSSLIPLLSVIVGISIVVVSVLVISLITTVVDCFPLLVILILVPLCSLITVWIFCCPFAFLFSVTSIVIGLFLDYLGPIQYCGVCSQCQRSNPVLDPVTQSRLKLPGFLFFIVEKLGSKF